QGTGTQGQAPGQSGQPQSGPGATGGTGGDSQHGTPGHKATAWDTVLKVAGWANLTFGEDEGGEEGGIPGGMGPFNLGLGGQILYVALTVVSLVASIYKLAANIAEHGVLGVLRNAWKSIKGIVPAAKAALRDAGSAIKAGWGGLRASIRGLFLPRST